MYIRICRQGSTWSCSSIVDQQYIRSIMGPKTQMNYVLTAYSSCDKDSKFTLLHFMTDNYQSHLSASICALHIKFISSNERRVIHSLGYCCSVMITMNCMSGGWTVKRQEQACSCSVILQHILDWKVFLTDISGTGVQTEYDYGKHDASDASHFDG